MYMSAVHIVYNSINNGQISWSLNRLLLFLIRIPVSLYIGKYIAVEACFFNMILELLSCKKK